MNDERDQFIESLFAEAGTADADDGFNERVMAGVENRRRNVLFGRIAVVSLLVILEGLLSSPLQTSFGAAAEILELPMIDVSNQWVAALLAPMNSIAGVVGVLLLGLHAIYRKSV